MCKIFRSCGLSTGSCANELAENNPLSSLNLSHTLTAILFIVNSLRGQWCFTSYGLTLLNNQEIHELLQNTAAIFADWPNRFYKLLGLKSPLVGKLRPHYEWLYYDIYRNPRLACAEFDFFRDSLKAIFNYDVAVGAL
jgi:hypothetical protein